MEQLSASTNESNKVSVEEEFANREEVASSLGRVSLFEKLAVEQTVQPITASNKRPTQRPTSLKNGNTDVVPD